MLALGLASFSASFAGCKGGASRLEGRWHGVRAEGVAPEALAAANAFAMKTELNVSGSAMTIISPKESRSFEFWVVKDEKTGLVIGTNKERASEVETFTFDGEKTVKWSVDPTRSIVFVHE